MFQDFALFPHMNVAQNVAFGLDMQHLARPEKDARVAEVLDLVGLGHFARPGRDGTLRRGAAAGGLGA